MKQTQSLKHYGVVTLYRKKPALDVHSHSWEIKLIKSAYFSFKDSHLWGVIQNNCEKIILAAMKRK